MLSFTCTRSSVVLQYGMIVVVVRSHSVIKQRSCFFLAPSLARQPTRPLTLAKPNKVHWRLRDREFLERRLLKNVEDGVLEFGLLSSQLHANFVERSTMQSTNRTFSVARLEMTGAQDGSRSINMNVYCESCL